MCKQLFAVFLLLSLLNGIRGVCVNRYALYSVNATVHESKSHKGFNVNSNFNSLENYPIIDVYQANVTELCEAMVKNFPVLESLSMINVNLSKVEPNAFQNVPSLKRLSLAVNKLSHIPKGSFNRISSLEVLYLSDNQISSIEEGAFEDMPRLREVHLDRNKITQLNGNIFRDCHQISVIDLKFNQIERISKSSFGDLHPQHDNFITIFLNKNNIEELNDLSFDLRNPVNLHLEGNRIQQISTILHNLKERSRLYLSNNQISCVSDDVMENLKQTSKELYILENPITCDCVKRIDEILENETYDKQLLFYNTIFKCELFQFISFDR